MCPVVQTVRAFIFGSIEYALDPKIRARSKDARSIQSSLPKTGEGSGGVDMRKSSRRE